MSSLFFDVIFNIVFIFDSTFLVHFFIAVITSSFCYSLLDAVISAYVNITNKNNKRMIIIIDSANSISSPILFIPSK